MAYLDSQIGFSADLLDMNKILRGAHLTSEDTNGGFHLISYSIKAGNLTLPLTDHTFSYNSGYSLLRPNGGAYLSMNGTDFVMDGDVLVGGRLNALEFKSDYSGDLMFSYGFDLSAGAAFNAAVTQTKADDRALLGQILAGNDLVRLSDANDLFASGGGKDLVTGGGGADTINAGDGSDLVLGGTGNDQINGGAGNDILWGGKDADLLLGGRGADLLMGGPGDDTMTGGLGADRFVFSNGEGHDHITDFTAGQDRILIQTGAARFADLHITQVGTGTEIGFGTTVLTLENVQAVTLHATDFRFAATLPQAGMGEAASQGWMVGWDYVV